MTILKDKYGNEIDSKDFENKGFGEFGKHIRRTIDPDWGIHKQDKEGGIKHYRVNYTANANVEGSVTVWAYDEEEAERLAAEQDVDWEISFYSNTTDPEVQQIEEIGEEE